MGIYLGNNKLKVNRKFLGLEMVYQLQYYEKICFLISSIYIVIIRLTWLLLANCIRFTVDLGTEAPWYYYFKVTCLASLISTSNCVPRSCWSLFASSTMKRPSKELNTQFYTTTKVENSVEFNRNNWYPFAINFTVSS